jgi:hypothetical protein
MISNLKFLQISKMRRKAHDEQGVVVATLGELNIKGLWRR